MRLSALEILDKMQLCYGLRMLEVFKEADIFSKLIKMYGLFPFNDIALRFVSNVLCFGLDDKLAREAAAKQTAPQKPVRVIQLEPINPVEGEVMTEEESESA